MSDTRLSPEIADLRATATHTDPTSADFDISGDLPESGTFVLEASAGTGKTYTIAALAARYLAEGIPLSRLLIVTFSRAATQELRDRVQSRLLELEAALTQRLAPTEASSTELTPTGEPSDPVTRLLLAGPATLLDQRLQRITAALSDFDRATIATTHEFCGQMLDRLGLLSGRDPALQHTEQISELTREVATDFWLRKYAFEPQPALPYDDAVQIAQRVVEFVGELAPDSAEGAAAVQFARAVRAEVQRRKRARGWHTYHDLLTDLQDLLHHEELGQTVKQRLRARYDVVLIDEFQDTDPIQWDIVQTAFVGHATVILIGDPKQAIYGFRGADVHSYLEAVNQPGARRLTLSTNYRTDQPLVAALDAVLGGAELGDPQIVVGPVRAAHPDSRLRTPDPAHATPLRLRYLPVPDQPKLPGLKFAQQHIRNDVIGQIRSLLEAPATLRDGTGYRPVRPGDLAILVQTNRRADQYREALAEAGVPVVYPGGAAVFETPEARAWLALLRAIRTREGSDIRAAALTGFGGWTYQQLAEAGDAEQNGLAARFKEWGAVYADGGPALLADRVLADGLAARIVAHPGGERRLTDLRHIGQLLHEAQVQQGLGLTTLIEWLEEQLADAADEGNGPDRTRRLETDANAVQIMTVHRAKGLEFPIVFLPDLWLGVWENGDRHEPVEYHDGRRRRLFLGSGPGREAAVRSRDEEKAADKLRSLYVALTRAQSQVVAYWAPSKRTPDSPLHRVLNRRGRAQIPVGADVRSDPGNCGLSHPSIAIETFLPTVPGPAEAAEVPALRLRTFDRSLDQLWRRTSYSGLTVHAHATAPETLGALEDEPEIERTPPAPLGGALAAVSPMADLPRGAEFGTLVHAVYEHFDPTAPDLAEELLQVVTAEVARTPIDLSAEELAAGLLPGVQTPLGDLSGGLRLCDLSPADRLAELDFEFPLAGGSHAAPGTGLRLSGIADLLDAHLPPDDLLRGYPDRLRDPGLGEQVLRGFLTGSIDAVLRIPSAPGPRFVVVDYKTNWLGPPDATELLIGHYRPEAMAQAMMQAHYPLQALLYSVALHRYLSWRLPAYDPAQHLGGVGYLFVRGMAGPDTPVVDGMPCGVFTWRPSAALVLDLSAAIDQGAAEVSR